MAASYPTSVKSFTTKVDGAGNTIAAAHINALQDEVVAVEDALENGFTHALKPTVAGAETLGTTPLPWGEVYARRVVPPLVTLSDGATPALDASLGTTFLLTAAGDRTIAVPTNPIDGQKIVIRHKASGADRTLALNSGAGGFRFGTDVTALTATTSAKTDYIGAIYNGADTKWDVVAYVKGY